MSDKTERRTVELASILGVGGSWARLMAVLRERIAKHDITEKLLAAAEDQNRELEEEVAYQSVALDRMHSNVSGVMDERDRALERLDCARRKINAFVALAKLTEEM